MTSLLQIAKAAPSAHYFQGYRDGWRWDAKQADQEAKKTELSQAIVAALEDAYTSGVEALLSYAIEGDTIYGRFRDGAKTLAYTLKDTEIAYWLVTGAERADSLLDRPVWRRDRNPPTKGPKGRKCTKGIKCGNSCINSRKTCKVQPSPEAKQQIATAKKLIPDVLAFEQEFNRAVESDRSKAFEQDLDKAVSQQEQAKTSKPKEAEPAADFGDLEDADFLEPVDEPTPKPKKKQGQTKSGKSSEADEDRDERLEKEVSDRAKQIEQEQGVKPKTAEKRARIEVFSERLQRDFGVTDPKKAERWAKGLVDFTGDNYRTIRRFEAGKKRGLDHSVADWNRAKKSAAALQEMLDESPKAEGAVFRGLTFKTQTQFDDFMKSIEGGTMEMNAMSSFSASEEITRTFALNNPEAQTRGVILRSANNRSGVDISTLSEYSHEREVLVPKGTKYRVKGVTEKNGMTYVDIEEVGSDRPQRTQAQGQRSTQSRPSGTLSSGATVESRRSKGAKETIQKYARYAERQAARDDDYEANADIWKELSRPAATDSYLGIRDQAGNLQSAASYSVQSDSLYVSYLATSPWNVKGNDRRRMKGAGSAAIEGLVLESIKRGKGGALNLESLNGAIGFYEKIGFQRTAEGSNEMSLSADAAKAWLDRRGVRYDAKDDDLDTLEEQALGAFAMAKKRTKKEVSDRFSESDPGTFIKTTPGKKATKQDGYDAIMREPRIRPD